jgi:hypothetical protein
VTVVDRALREKEPGVYATDVPLPEAGTYEIAFIMDAPQILHCFNMAAVPNPQIVRETRPLAIEYLVEDRQMSAGETFRLRFQLTDPATGQLRSNIKDVRVLFYRAPGQGRTEVGAKEVRHGIYEALLPIRWRGAYYIHVSSPSVKVPYGELPYLTLMGVPKKAARQPSPPTEG